MDKEKGTKHIKVVIMCNNSTEAILEEWLTNLARKVLWVIQRSLRVFVICWLVVWRFDFFGAQTFSATQAESPLEEP